ncbi:MAG: ester cyclase [Actinobacteria bacterium]|jgi:steroid delta-isomerase-like uncharacterized protein|nr:ester cyclase [Actinomycetota bacterium]
MTRPSTDEHAQMIAANKAAVLRAGGEVWSKGDLDVVDELCTPDYVCHFVVGLEWRGREGIREQVRSHRTSFPDWHEQVDDIVAEGDRVAIRFTSTGTHLGEFSGIPPTGKKASIREIAIHRMVDGMIAEQWGMPDQLGLMQQLGEGQAGAGQGGDS